MDSNSLSHTKWNCKYHIVFAPKFRRKIIYGKLKRDIANILSALCKRKGVKIVEAEMCSDQVAAHICRLFYRGKSVGSFSREHNKKYRSIKFKR